MKNLLTFFAILFVGMLSKAQITSSNVLEYVEQIEASAKSSMIDANTIIQIGNDNVVEVYETASNNLFLRQLGDQNTTYFSANSSYATNAEINVRGSGNYIEIQGVNSISDGMKININANDTTLLMRNH